MTKRRATQPKPATTATINSKAPTEAVETVKGETNTVVAPKRRRTNTTAKKPTGATTNKGVATVSIPTPVSKAIDVTPKVVPSITHVAENRAILVSEKPSLYDRFVGWLYRVTYNFRG